ncbi:hypothetical protein EV424DRAFT_1347897 [Suillus variegatus]|nr:hypothetical protein EV424DRAFT_1347897 [Suillus variegatus]
MTLSDDFLLDPSNWTSDPLRARLMRLRDLIQQESTPTIPTSTLPVDDPSSVTEPESKPENPPQPAIPTPTLPVDDPSSMTEPESEPERSAPAIPTPTIPVDDPSSVTEPESEPERAAPAIPTPTIPVDDPSSVTEPESKPENPPQPEFSTPIKIKGATPVPKKKGFFDTPSPPVLRHRVVCELGWDLQQQGREDDVQVLRLVGFHRRAEVAYALWAMIAVTDGRFVVDEDKLPKTYVVIVVIAVQTAYLIRHLPEFLIYIGPVFYPVFYHQGQYISREEDDRWYDRSKTDDSFDALLCDGIKVV